MPSSLPGARTLKVRLKFPAFAADGKDVAYLACADDFDAHKPFIIVLFFHGFDLPFDEQVVRHALAEQVVQSGRNCVLVCPRTAISRTTEHNPGAFGDESYFVKFLGELAAHIAALAGDASLATDDMAARTDKARLGIAAFSAGHRVASAVLSYASVRDRLAFCAFFDSLYEGDYYYKFPEFVLGAGALVGVYRSVYDQGADERDNHKELIAKLTALNAAPARSIYDVDDLHAGVAVMESVQIGDHWRIVSDSARLAHIVKRVRIEASGADAD